MGWLMVGVLALAAFVGVQLWANAAEDGWRDDRAVIADANLAITRGNLSGSGADAPQRPYPDEPFVVAHTAEVAIGAALAVAVVGSVVVLLATIAARLPDRST